MRWKIAQLRDSGIDIVRVLSTDEAMNTLNNKVSFGAIISDMGRREQGAYRSQAGLVLLNAIKRAGYTLPFLEPISKSSEEDNEAGELYKAEEVLSVVLPADEDATLPLYPGEEALDEPAPHVTA